MDRTMREGWTLAELVVVSAIIAVLAGIALPSASAMLRLARRTACAGNLRQVGMCTLAYVQDWNGLLPAEGCCGIYGTERSPAWFDRLPNYLDDDQVAARSIFQCAAFRWPGAQIFCHAVPKSFKMNAYLDAAGRSRHYRQGSARGEAGVMLFADAVAGETGMGQWGHCFASAVTDQRHPGAVNVLHLDGHTCSVVRTPADGAWCDAITWLPEGWAGGP
jgi:prepilin-type N-terminal cleavage/methylation domain-containing protein/prepilin-type processing-associated H-X9-DG protein